MAPPTNLSRDHRLRLSLRPERLMFDLERILQVLWLQVSTMGFTRLRLAMFPGVLFVVAAFGAVLVCQTTPNQNELSKFLTPTGKLRAPLGFRDSQEGFAGVSGEIWTIGAGGHFSIARFLNERTDAPYWGRDLTPIELERVAKVLAANNFLALPDSFGGESKVNSRLLTLTFGKKKSILALAAGEGVTEESSPPASDPQTPAWHNFVSIVRAIRALAKDRKAI